MSATDDFDSQYAALTVGAGLVDFSSRTQIELTGRDGANFLHNLCTNSIRDLPAGSGREAFVLNVKGHTIGHVFIFACPNSHVLETVPGQGAKLLAHFDRYLIREDVELHDRSQEWAEALLAGPRAQWLLAELGLPVPQERLAHVAANLGGKSLWLRRVDIVGRGDFLIACPRDHLADVRRSLIATGALATGDEAFEAARIENGAPLYGLDITDENLPQEIDRDRLAISFTKGCYLGQETVARIDALGHVNRLLCGVKSSGTAFPIRGTALLSEVPGKAAGQVTSSCWSPRLNAPLAMAFIQRGHHGPGTKLSWEGGPAEVVRLPLGSASES